MRAAFLSVPLLLAAIPVEAQQAETYTVVPGDDCETVAKKIYGDKKLLPLLHEANPQLGPVPHHLVPGQVLRTPKPGAEAKVTFIRKDVEAATPVTHPAKMNEDLDRGHKVSTLASSSAEITFKDTTRLQLSEHTLVVILGGSSAQSSTKQAAASDTTLLTGELHAHLGALVGKPKPVVTPGARIEVGGESRVSVDEKKTTRLSVYQGKSTLASSGAKVEVNKGFGSKADLGKKPTKPKPLPVAPTWTTPAPRTLVAIGAPDLAATHSAAAPGVARFHLQLARDLAFNDLVVDARVPASIVSLEAKALPAGTYHARVSAIDDDAFEGAYGDVMTTQVVSITPVASAEGKRASVSVSPGAFCGLDDAPLAAASSLELTPARAHTLRCAPDATGTGAAELVLESKLAGSVHAETSFGDVAWNAGSGSRELSLRLTDAAGAPVSGAKVTVRAPARVVADPVREDPPGTYVTHLQFPPGVTGDVAFELDGAPQHVVPLPRADAPSTIAPSPGSSPFRATELGAFLGVQHARERFGFGSVLGLEGTYGFRVGATVLAVGVRGDWERYGISEGNGFHLGDAFAVGLPIALRFGGRLQVFGQAVPQFLVDRVRINIGQSPKLPRDVTESVVLPAVRLGAGLRFAFASSAALHLEGGYRFAPTHAVDTGDVSLAGPYAVLSGRFIF